MARRPRSSHPRSFARKSQDVDLSASAKRSDMALASTARVELPVRCVLWEYHARALTSASFPIRTS
eukprot:3860292-Pyramimonas_sp.AAC.1